MKLCECGCGRTARLGSKYATHQCSYVVRRERKSDYSPHHIQAEVVYPGCAQADYIARAKAIKMLLDNEFEKGTRIRIDSTVLLVE